MSDTLITLAADRLRTELRPDDLFGPVLAPHTTTNGTFMVLPTATARDAFSLVYPEWFGYTHHLVTFNDAKVEMLNFTK